MTLVAYMLMAEDARANVQTGTLIQAFDELNDAVNAAQKHQRSLIAVVDVDGHIERTIDPFITTDEPMGKVQKEIERVLALEPDMTGVQSDSTILWEIAMRMADRGGSFVKVLGELYMRADSYNQHKILRTWPDYFIKYAA